MQRGQAVTVGLALDAARIFSLTDAQGQIVRCTRPPDRAGPAVRAVRLRLAMG